MKKIDNLKKELEYLRGSLNVLIGKKQNLLDPEVLELSQKLDTYIVRYNLEKDRQK